jgi:hypothetical protein
MSEVIERPSEERSTALTIIPPAQLPTILAMTGAPDILQSLAAELAAFKADISTPKGRAAIASMAAKVATAKMDIVRIANTTTEEWRTKTKLVVSERKDLEDRMDALKAKVRAPLTEFENREKERVAAHEAALAAIAESPGWGVSETAFELTERLEYLENYPARDWQEFAQRAADALSAEIERTRMLKEAAEKREAEAAELERLRAEQAERDRQEAARLQAEREARIAAEAAEKARAEAERKAAEEARKAEEAVQRAEYHRSMLQHVKEVGFGFIGGQPQASGILQYELTEKIKFDEENFGDLLPEALIARDEALKLIQRAIDVKVERERVEREAKAAEERALRAEADRLASEQRAKEAAEKAERDRTAAEIAAVEAERRRAAQKAESERIEAERRAANLAHRKRINNEALADIVASLAHTDIDYNDGPDIATQIAKAVVAALAKGEIRHCTISY